MHPVTCLQQLVWGTPEQRSACACRDIHEGTYYPAVSLFTLPQEAEGATVTCNFGAHLQAPACFARTLQPDQPAACHSDINLSR